MRKIISVITAFVIMTAGFPTESLADDSWEYQSEEVWYSTYSYGDKNYISDEEFFGEYDSSKNTWIKTPYIEYGNFQELSEAETLVKQGNYSAAKEKITQYYKNKFSSQPRKLSSAQDSQTALYAKTQAYNCFLNKGGTPLDIIEFTDSEDYISADVTDTVKSVRTSSKKDRTIELVALEKDGAFINLHSRESAFSPYVKVTVNGTLKTYYAIYDTYLRGGSYSTQNNGTSQEMIIAEGDYSNTFRTRITFDFSDINSSDNVTVAKLYVKGNSTNSLKKVLVFENSNGAGSSNVENLTWDNDTSRVYVSFNGSMGPELLKSNFSQSKLYTFVNYTALYNMYRATKKEVYAYHAFRLYNNFISKYGKRDMMVFLDDNYSTCLSDKLELGTRAEALPEFLAHLSDSIYFNADNFIPILKFAWQMGNALVNCWDSQSESGNWGIYQTAGLANLMLNFKEFSDVRKPLEDGGYGNGKSGGWINVVNHRYSILSENIIRNDGSFTESIAYGSESISQFISYTENAAKAGTTCELTDELKNNLDKIGLYIMNATGPDFRDFQIGDCYNNAYSFRAKLKKIADYTLHPNLVWAGLNGAYGVKPANTSVLYPDNRKAIMKSGWSAEDVYMDFTADAGISSHNHPDDLSLVMFAYGDYLLSDQGQFNYTANDPMRCWMYSTRAHNTVEVNGLSHKQALSGIGSDPIIGPDGKTLQFNKVQSESPGTVKKCNMIDCIDFVKMETPNYLDYTLNGVTLADVDYTRSVLFAKNKKYVIVSDFLEAKDDRLNHFAQNWHMLPNANMTLNDNTFVSKSNTSSANLQIIPVKTNGLNAAIENGYYSPQNEMFERAQYVSYTKDVTGNTVFNTLLLPADKGEQLDANVIKLNCNLSENEASAFYADFSDGTKTEYFQLHDETKQGENTFGDYVTDAEVVFIESTGGAINHIYLVNGSYVKIAQSSKLVLSTKSNVEYIDVDFSDMKISVTVPEGVNKNDIAVLKKEKLLSGTINGEEASVYQEFGKVSFAQQAYAEENVCFNPKEAKGFLHGINVEFTSSEEAENKYTVEKGGETGSKVYISGGLRLSAASCEDYPEIDLTQSMSFSGASKYYNYYYELEANVGALSQYDTYRLSIGGYNASDPSDEKTIAGINIGSDTITWGAFGSYSGENKIYSQNLSNSQKNNGVKVGILINTYTGTYSAYLNGYLVGELVGKSNRFGFVPCSKTVIEYVPGTDFTASQIEFLSFNGYMLKNDKLPIISNDIEFNFDNISDVFSAGRIVAKTTLYNKNSSENDVAIVLAIYDNSDKLLRIKINTQNVSIREKQVISVSDRLNSGEWAKAFILNPLEQLVPVHSCAQLI